jgi:3,4-dihydroxy 2-butanone 4-phosphate synthase / GTP cyclohydrolase II
MSIENGVKHFKRRSLAIIIDDLNQRDCAVLALFNREITHHTVNELLLFSGSTIFCALTPCAVRRLDIPEINRQPSINYRASTISRNHLISVEARHGVLTGISAKDRSLTLIALTSDKTGAEDIVYPGHIYPIKTHEFGCIANLGLPEAVIDLNRLIDEESSGGAFVDLLGKDGGRLKAAEAEELGRKNDLPIFHLSDLVKHRLKSETVVSCLEQAKIPTLLGGDLNAYLFRSPIRAGDHLALVKGEINPETPILTRLQQDKPLEDLFGRHKEGSTNLTSRSIIEESLRTINLNGSGILIYLRSHELDVLALKEHSAEDIRLKAISSQILKFLGVKKIITLKTCRENLAETLNDFFGIEIVGKTTI